jgi:uncharacterized protein YciI
MSSRPRYRPSQQRPCGTLARDIRYVEDEMWFLTLHRWTGDRHEAIRSSLDDHLAWQRQQQLAGKVLIAGPTPDETLGIIVFGHMSQADVDELCSQEPLHRPRVSAVRGDRLECSSTVGYRRFRRENDCRHDAIGVGLARHGENPDHNCSCCAENVARADFPRRRGPRARTALSPVTADPGRRPPRSSLPGWATVRRQLPGGSNSGNARWAG